MTRLILPALLTFTLLPAEGLSTKYTEEASLRIEVSSDYHMETVDFSLIVDGEPMDGMFGGGPTTDEKRELIMIDTVLTTDEGAPTSVRREFDTVSSHASMVMGDFDRENDRDCPLDGLTVEITENEGETTTTVIDGSEPDNEHVLKGHATRLALDALLPGGDVEPGAAWAPTKEDLARALGYDLELAYFPVAHLASEGGSGHVRGPGGSIPSAARYFSIGDWEIEAVLGDEPEDYNDQPCYVITIEAEASGEVPDVELEVSSDHDHMDGMLGGARTTRFFEKTFEAEIEATLYISVENKRPVHFELEANFGIESVREMDRHGNSMVMTSVQEAVLKYTVDVKAVAADDE